MNQQQIQQLEELDYTFYAIRVMTGGVVVEEGDELQNSFEWVDGVATDNELNGTCGLSLRWNGWSFESGCFEKMMKEIKPYLLRTPDAQVIIIGGDYAEEGNDLYEIIVEDAVCVHVIK